MTLLLAAAVTSETVMLPRDPSDYTSMRPRELEAFQDVAHKCHRDVSYHCDESPFIASASTTTTTSLPHFPLTLFRAANEDDPFTDLGLLLDSIFAAEQHHRVPMLQQPEMRFIMVLDGSEAVSSSATPDESPSHEHAMAEQALSHIAAMTDMHTMDDTAEHVQHHAQWILQHPETTDTQRRLARRLQAVATPDALLEQRRNFLPFGCPRRNQCLQRIYQQRLVSPPCGLALQRLENVRAIQHLESVQRYHEQQFVLKHLLLLYLLVLATMAVLYCRRGAQIRQTRRLKRRILTAVYSQPALKAAIETELGESIGTVPPLRWRALMKFGLHGREYRAWSKIARRVWLATVMCSAALLVVAPTLFLPLCVTMAAALFWCAISTRSPVRVCACCCCGASTEDVKNGTLTQDQECCGCCQGTGVCAPSCASCCGNDDDTDDKGCCCCSCCGGAGCCCCCSSGSGKSTSGGCCGCCSSCCSSSSPKNDGGAAVSGGGCCGGGGGDGCCCCGGGSTSGSCSCSTKKKKTKACSCCGGSGCCCCSGVACCVTDCKCCSGTESHHNCNKPSAIIPNLCIYEGIPLQVV